MGISGFPPLYSTVSDLLFRFFRDSYSHDSASRDFHQISFSHAQVQIAKMAAVVPRSVLVTGGNRGIGLGFVKHYLALAGVERVFATAREPSTSEVRYFSR